MATSTRLSPMFHEYLVMPLSSNSHDGNLRHLTVSVTFLRLSANICVHLRWDVVSLAPVPGGRRHVPTPYSLPRPGVLVSVPANPLQAPIVFIAQRLDGFPLRRRFLVVVSFYLGHRAPVDAIEAQMELQWMPPSRTLTAPLEACPEFALQQASQTPSPPSEHDDESS
ncbi:hypothetical protein C8Q76DRAFT_790418 [Earliella scabrosa]|nr:hypothetical protein C8Q76DRAFT_790418 [Earliella scabrosa]